MPSCGVWWGVAANPLDGESWDEALPGYERLVDRTVDIAHYYNASPELFPSADMIARAREPGAPRLLLLNWKPEMGRTWAEVAAGDPEVDAAIDAQAAYWKSTFPEKFFLVIHHEPEDEVIAEAGSGMTARDYRAMYRHVVQRLRAAGVRNAVLVMNYMGTAHWGGQPWFAHLYPGDDVVDWIAFDPYVQGEILSLATAIDQRNPERHPDWPGFYTWVTRTYPEKPLMLAEWGVDRELGNKKRAAVFASMPRQLHAFPRIAGLVYWHGNTDMDTYLREDEDALRALRNALADPILRSPTAPR